MTSAGDLSRRVTFQKRGPDENQDPLGDWVDVYTCAAKVVSVKGGETVQAQRLAGNQPAVIVVRRCGDTRDIDNAYRAVDARDLARGVLTAWDVASAIWNEKDNMMEFFATQHRARDA